MQKRGYHDFSFNFLCLTGPNRFVGEHFGVSKNFGYRKILCIRERGGYHVSPSKTFCLTVPIKFVEEPFCVLKEFWYRKVSSKGGGGKLHGLVEIFFLTGPRKLRQGTILCFRKFLVGKIFFG